MGTIHLTLSPEYVVTWGTWQAVREILQNAIDTKDYKVKTKQQDQTFDLSVLSKGGVLEKRTLLLGETSKKNDSSSIGMYGEGFKLAMLVLLREGKEVFIKNGKDLWTPSFEIHPILETKCLTIEIQENHFPENEASVEFVVNGLSLQEIKEIESKTLEQGFEKYLGNSFEDDTYGTYKGSSYWRDDKPKLFVGGLFVCELEEGFELSYNFLPDILTLDRDRNSAEGFFVSYEATKLIAYSGNTKLLAELANDGAKDVSDYADMTSSGGYHGYSGSSGSSSLVLQKKLKEDASNKFLKVYGENAYPIDSRWDAKKIKVCTKRAIDAGLTPVSLKHGYYNMLSKEVTEKELGSYQEFNLSSALRTYYEENKNQLRGKPKKALEDLIDTMNLYDGNIPMPESLKEKLIVDDDDIPF